MPAIQAQVTESIVAEAEACNFRRMCEYFARKGSDVTLGQSEDL